MATERAREGYLRLSQERKERFLEVLGQTGNRSAAAEAIGVEPRLMDQRREHDPVLDRLWREALLQAHRRLSGADGPFDCIGTKRLNVIVRGRGGLLKLVASGQRMWNRTVEDRFIAALSMCGCIAAAARAIGFSQSSVYERRRRYPEFARRLEQALEDAELTIEFRCALEGGAFDFADLGGANHDVEAGEEAGTVTSDCLQRPEGAAPGQAPAPAPPTGRTSGFDREFALRFLKWREEKRRGGGKRGRAPTRAPRPIEEVIESVMRKIAAIKRHEARGGGAPEPR
jgi:hypothetical protein